MAGSAVLGCNSLCQKIVTFKPEDYSWQWSLKKGLTIYIVKHAIGAVIASSLFPLLVHILVLTARQVWCSC